MTYRSKPAKMLPRILKHILPPPEEYDHNKTIVRYTNKRLTKIGKELGISLKLTSYVARHCFVTIQKTITLH
jgi:hypothetical protein